MTDRLVPQLTARFDELSQRLPDEGIEFWFARDLTAQGSHTKDLTHA